jgi:hypothetical protein
MTHDAEEQMMWKNFLQRVNARQYDAMRSVILPSTRWREASCDAQLVLLAD